MSLAAAATRISAGSNAQRHPLAPVKCIRSDPLHSTVECRHAPPLPAPRKVRAAARTAGSPLPPPAHEDGDWVGRHTCARCLAMQGHVRTMLGTAAACVSLLEEHTAAVNALSSRTPGPGPASVHSGQLQIQAAPECNMSTDCKTRPTLPPGNSYRPRKRRLPRIRLPSSTFTRQGGA